MPPPQTFKINFNTAVQFTLTTSKWYLTVRSSDENSVCISHTPTRTTGCVFILHFISNKNIWFCHYAVFIIAILSCKRRGTHSKTIFSSLQSSHAGRQTHQLKWHGGRKKNTAGHLALCSNLFDNCHVHEVTPTMLLLTPCYLHLFAHKCQKHTLSTYLCFLPWCEMWGLWRSNLLESYTLSVGIWLCLYQRRKAPTFAVNWPWMWCIMIIYNNANLPIHMAWHSRRFQPSFFFDITEPCPSSLMLWNLV
jgi:hypothetical protein